MNAPALNVLRAVVCKYRESGAISKNADFFLIQQKYNIQYSKTIFKSSSEAPFLQKIGKLKIGLNLVEGRWKLCKLGHFQNAYTKKQKLIHSSSLPGLFHNSQSFFQAIFYLDLGFLSISYTRAKKVMFHALMTP